jgi:hypothetical protein
MTQYLKVGEGPEKKIWHADDTGTHIRGTCMPLKVI